ncbi:MAG: PucR family transcriptional regulator ligand-binding domain-containing protein [Bacillota bacterium]|nr:PucR family transcriptional regulator ligand-binding domain-containing protein [Bacillota bacterium]MDD3297903.1 PucR family transcriptional regulator ligand-binding domain-containing protein [Bacillota bacterium]MDD3851762.1 PucR family transcriptional regulator ligand-binding domain-containing protein [Bacillota bacterium]MDD4707706.1 PucR family transcriptional regulator ligand-binding domain-containing protein [Bacillota bacterium]
MYRERGITVEEILELDILAGARVIAGADGLDRAVSGVNVMEVPDIFNWVKKGEFILTTAYSIRNDSEAQVKLIPEFDKRGLAGLGIKTKRYIDTLPDRMIEIANKLRFPIIELPIDVSFTDIINPILENIVNKQTALLIRIDDVHQRLMNVLLEGGSLRDIAFVLHRLVVNPLVIEDIILNNMYPAGDRDFLDKAIGHLAGGVHKSGTDRIVDREIKRITLPIISGKKAHGYIHVWEWGKLIFPIDQRVLEDSLAIIALEITKQIAVLEVERKYKNEFLEDLLSGNPDMYSIALERASFFGMDLGNDYVAIVLKINSLGKSFKKTLNNSYYLQYYKASIIRSIERVLRDKRYTSIIGSKSDQIIILVGVDGMKGPIWINKSVSDVAGEIFQRVKEEINDSNIIMAIGKYFPGHQNIWKSYNTALKGITLARYLDKKIINFDGLGVYRLLCNEHIQPELEYFLNDNLKPILEYDKARNGELLKTLEMYFKYNGNLKKVSEAMFTHYNTILYRMQKIRELTKMDLKDPNDRLSLQVAISIMRIDVR